MPGFSFRSQKEPSPEEPNTPESEATRERAARLRDLDEEIRHRRGELRASKEAEHAGPAPRASGERGVRTSPAEPEEEALADPIAATIEDALKDLLKLAGRVEALESSVREAQQRNWEALQTHEKTVNERIEELERRADDAAAEVAKGPTEAGERLEQRFAELEKRVSKASKARTRSGERIEKLEGRLDEIGRTQPSLEKRLAGLERALDGAVEQRLAGLEKLADEASAGATKAETEAGARIDKLADRLEVVEKLPERVQAVGEQIESVRKLADDMRALREPLALRRTELEAFERDAANGSRKLEQRLANTIETLTTRLDALDRRLREAEKRAARPQEQPAAPTPEAAKPSWG